MPSTNIVNMVSHLNNASKARLGLTSVRHTKNNLALALAMHRAGLISFVTRGGPHPPPAEELSTYKPEPLTTANVASQRLWLGLKYSNNEPVMRALKPITTPTRPVRANTTSLDLLARGFDASYQRGLGLGECMFVGTDRGVLEVREAVERRVGGLLLCRVSP